MRGVCRRTCAGLAALASIALAAEAGAQATVRLPAADRPLAGAAATLHTIAAERPGEPPLAGMAQVAFDARDQLYVLDRSSARVLVFDPHGRFVRQIGGRGGAGGLVAPAQMALTRGGEVVVADLGQRAFVVFGADGRRLRAVPFPGDALPGISLQPHAQGGVVSLVRPVSMQGALNPTMRTQQSLVWYRLGAGGDVPLFRASEEAQTEFEPGAETQRITTSTAVFSPSLQWAPLAGGGVAVANGTRWQVRLVGDDGRAVRVLERPLAPRRVSEADREWARARRRQALESGRGVTVINYEGGGGAPQRPSRSAVDAEVRAMEFAEVMPVIRRVAVDPSGRLWIGRSGARADQDGPVDVVTADGRYVGTLTGPGVPDAFSRSGRAAWIERGPGGEERVVVRSLPATWR